MCASEEREYERNIWRKVCPTTSQTFVIASHSCSRRKSLFSLYPHRSFRLKPLYSQTFYLSLLYPFTLVDPEVAELSLSPFNFAVYSRLYLSARNFLYRFSLTRSRLLSLYISIYPLVSLLRNNEPISWESEREARYKAVFWSIRHRACNGERERERSIWPGKSALYTHRHLQHLPWNADAIHFATIPRDLYTGFKTCGREISIIVKPISARYTSKPLSFFLPVFFLLF